MKIESLLKKAALEDRVSALSKKNDLLVDTVRSLSDDKSALFARNHILEMEIQSKKQEHKELLEIGEMSRVRGIIEAKLRCLSQQASNCG
jgi:hypothetical protein